MDRRAALKTLLAGTAVVTTGVSAAARTPESQSVTGGGVPQESASDRYAPQGSVDLPATAEAVVDESGDYAFVATLEGFAVVDIRIPDSPRVVAQRTSLMADFESGPLNGVADLRWDDDRLLVGGPYNGAGSLRGFVLFDVSDPQTPERILAHGTDSGHHNLEYEDGFAYVSTWGATAPEVTIFDLRGDQVEERGAWDLTDADPGYADLDGAPVFIHDLWVESGVAYLAYWDAGTFIVDVSIPDTPAFVGWVPGLTPAEIAESNAEFPLAELPGNHHFVTVNDDASLLAVGMEAWDAPQTDGVGGPGGIELWDITDPANPTRHATIDAPPGQGIGFNPPETTAHNCDIEGDRLYSAWYNGGVKIHDVSDPANPEELAWWRLPEETSFWTAQYATEDTFVASSITIGGRSRRAALFTFPNEPGTQENPPQLGESPTPTPRLHPETITETPPSQTATPTPDSLTETEPPTATPTADPSETPTTTPGFGVVATLTGLSLAAWHRLDRNSDD